MRRVVGAMVVAVVVLLATTTAATAATSTGTGTEEAARSRPRSHLDQVITALETVTPETEGTVWRDTRGNRLPGDVTEWFLQTPNCWGASDCPDPVGTQRLLAAIADVIGGAERSVDITTLYPFADGAFFDAIASGLRRSIARGHRPTVRVLAGTPYLYSYFVGVGPDTWRTQLLAAIGPQAAALPIAVATQTTNLQSWNHAKMVSVDGRQAIVGGHNMWKDSYLSATPVSDVSMRIQGPAAAAATELANVLWGDLCQRRTGWLGFFSVRYSASSLAGCPTTMPTARTRPGDVRILSVGRLGIGLPVPGASVSGLEQVGLSVPCPFQDQFNDDPEFEVRNPGKVAARALIASADSRIFLSQQDLLGFCPRYDKRLFEVLAQKMIEGVDITIVVTGAFGTSYANMESLHDLSEQLFAVLAPMVGDAAKAEQIMCSTVQLGSLQIGTAPKWPDGSGYANHAKVISVDDEAFAVGSGNLYPANLQELDELVEDPDAAEAMRASYLDPLWEWSSPTAIIDPDRGICQIAG